AVVACCHNRAADRRINQPIRLVARPQGGRENTGEELGNHATAPLVEAYELAVAAEAAEGHVVALEAGADQPRAARRRALDHDVATHRAKGDAGHDAADAIPGGA